MDSGTEELAGRVAARVAAAKSSLTLSNSQELLAKAVMPNELWFGSAVHHMDGCAFFSHQSRDFAFANVFCQLLERDAARYDFDTHPYWRFLFNGRTLDSRRYEPHVAMAICMCNVVLLIASRNAANSHYVPLEIDIASALGTPIICVLLDDVELGKVHPSLHGAIPYLEFSARGEGRGAAPIVSVDANDHFFPHWVLELLKSDPFRPRYFGGPSRLVDIPGE
jgi:hypothetical protein